ncbi:hypothetical protein DM02DRAFT_620794 [Periconia macrospinosa]|uniref:Uncharacterized protein n=1 Tax=Periconia macrospinosa TaxID=97972 RepID=A0A2V1CYW1_9PLEO|nr:hypothetical protein DM02DRAFT_620794 [Periconia macrospinosa]
MRMCFFAMCVLLLIRSNALASAGEPLLAARRRVQLAAHVLLQSRSYTREMSERITYPEVHVSDVQLISAKGRQLIRPRNGEPLGYGKVSHSVVARRATR